MAGRLGLKAQGKAPVTPRPAVHLTNILSLQANKIDPKYQFDLTIANHGAAAEPSRVVSDTIPGQLTDSL